MSKVRKPKLLVTELWALGDLVIAVPFLQAACQRFEVALLAKPYARDLGAHFFPSATVIAFTAPWTAFRHKYRLVSWPWRDFLRLRALKKESFDIGLSARWDPRDHFLLRFLGAKQRMGFPRSGSRIFLTTALPRPDFSAHRYEYWRIAGRGLGLDLPEREQVGRVCRTPRCLVVVHTGAGQRVRVWPLPRYQNLVGALRQAGYEVKVLCDSDQQDWWQSVGESNATAPQSIKELLAILETAGAFVGNDSGPGHLAALTGVPTFTLFGPQLSQWFAPLHPAAQWLDGSPCPYKPCWDNCRFPSPNCLHDLKESAVVSPVLKFVAKHIEKPGMKS
jgi:ADP-heptose:LPS heptosyltransferase